MPIDKILQEFDESFGSLNAVKREPDGRSVTNDIKQFIIKAIEQAVAEERKRILDALPKGYICVCCSKIRAN